MAASSADVMSPSRSGICVASPMFGAMLGCGVSHEKAVADEARPLIPGFQPDIPVKQSAA
jgi:hypothetical protein